MTDQPPNTWSDQHSSAGTGGGAATTVGGGNELQESSAPAQGVQNLSISSTEPDLETAFKKCIEAWRESGPTSFLTREEKDEIIQEILATHVVPGDFVLSKKKDIKEWFHAFTNDDRRSEFLAGHTMNRFRTCFGGGPGGLNVNAEDAREEQKSQAAVDKEMVKSVRELANYWRFEATTHLIQVDTALRVHGAKKNNMLNGMYSLFCRQCYFEVASWIFRKYYTRGRIMDNERMKRRALEALKLLGYENDVDNNNNGEVNYVNVFGNVGVGKSVLLWFMLVICIKTGIPVQLQGVKEANGMQGSCVVVEDGTVCGVQDLTAARDVCEWLYIADHQAPALAPGCVVLFVTSPARSRTNQWVKSRGSVYIMPVWTQKEITTAGRVCYGLEEQNVVDVFGLCGGVPRVCFASHDEGHQVHLQELTESIQAEVNSITDLQKLDQILRKGVGEVDQDSNAYRVWHVVNKLELHSPHMFRKGLGVTVLSSRIVEKMLEEHLIKVQKFDRVSLYKMLRQIPGSKGVAGRMFEPMAHEALVTKKLGNESGDGEVHYVIKHLGSGRSPSNHYSNLSGGELQMVKFQNLDELNTTPENTLTGEDQYFVSTNGSFGSIESFQISKVPVIDVECFQMTESLDHGVKTNPLIEFRRGLLPKLHERNLCTNRVSPEQLRLRLFFVIPPESYDAPFKFQTFTAAIDNVYQYALKLDATSYRE